ncbi:hypothetical protein GKZ28_22565 [Clostridium chromiireducens]|uniref:Lipoprotein n=1 Tax=Clostridium chromiireducens TaxID=225345 RepID=A0A964RRM2_9CLOT|nr:hypothetical protein [Clostridium chromiireducens]MVX66462.1 hypothetical protein [Clostridium chromiireducens]
MISKFGEKSKIWFAACIIGTITISSASIMGCGTKKSPKIDAENKGISVEKVSENSDEMEDKKPIEVTKSDDGKNNFTEYINLLGLSKEKLISKLNENPSSVGEGGLEFKKAGIRVWFDQKNNDQVEQIFTMRNDLNLNGVKIGDKISKFKEVFGNPVSDKNGDAHFKYNNIFLSINYDTKTEQAYAVYILKNDF